MQNTVPSSAIVHVAVAVLVNNNQVLVSKRPDGVHLGGCWEFPGGKVEPNEDVKDALQREIKEELDVELLQYRPLIKITHHYEDKSVLLDVWRVTEYSGEATGNEGQSIAWKSLSELNINDFPKADIAIIQAIKLPDNCLITGLFDSEDDFMRRLGIAISNGIKLVQCRITKEHIRSHGIDRVEKIIESAEQYCNENNITFILNCPDVIATTPSNNIHLNSMKLMASSKRPQCEIVSASCHNMKELTKASELGVDFVFLSPVKSTRSHPDTVPLGWQKFSQLLKDVNIPVYALGGVGDNDLPDAWDAGAQGVAGIGSYWG